MSCLLSLDLEDFKHATMRDMGVAPIADNEQVMRGVDALINTVDRHNGNSKITCFTTGQIARELPNLVNTLSRSGHEIGCHTDLHDNVYSLSKEQFANDLVSASKALRDCSESPVVGFRAPNFSINESVKDYFFEELAANGYCYDSSTVSASTRKNSSPVDIIKLKSGVFFEFPIYSAKYFGLNIRVIGGTYFRLLPIKTILGLLRESIEHGYPAVVYLHAADVDSRLKAIPTSQLKSISLLDRLRWKFKQNIWTYNTSSVLEKLAQVLAEFPNAGPMVSEIQMQKLDVIAS